MASNEDVVYAYHWHGKGKRMRAEIERRGLFSADEWGRIDSGRIRLGDRELVVMASWGPASVHRTTATWGTASVWDYGHADVVFENGRVVAIND